MNSETFKLIVSFESFIKEYTRLSEYMEWDLEKLTVDHRTMNVPVKVLNSDPRLFLGVILSTAFRAQAETAVHEAISLRYANRMSSRVLDFIEIIPLQVFGYNMNNLNRGGLTDVLFDSKSKEIEFTFLNPVDFLKDISERIGVDFSQIDLSKNFKEEFGRVFSRAFKMIDYLGHLPADTIPLFGPNSSVIAVEHFRREVLSMSPYDIGASLWMYCKNEGRSYNAEKLFSLINAISPITGLDQLYFENCLKEYLSKDYLKAG